MIFACNVRSDKRRNLSITFRSSFILIRQAAVLQRLLQDIVLPGAQRPGSRWDGGVVHDRFQRRQLRYHAVYRRAHISLGRDAGTTGFRGLGSGFLNKRGDSSRVWPLRVSRFDLHDNRVITVPPRNSNAFA